MDLWDSEAIDLQDGNYMAATHKGEGGLGPLR